MLKKIDEKDLQNLYWEKGMTLVQVGEVLGVRPETVLRHMEKLGIQRRTQRECKLKHPEANYFRNEAWLYMQYIVNNKVAYQIAREAHCSQHAILTWLKEFKIPISSATHRSSDIRLSKEAMEFIEGELLGDMCITINHRISGCIKYSSKHRAYLQWLSGMLKNFGIDQAGRILRKISKTVFYTYNSKNYPYLLKIRQRFYPEGKKIIPEDIEITPIVLRQWYIGDGCLSKYDGRIHLATVSFSEAEIDIVIKKFNIIGLLAQKHRQRKAHLITFPRVVVKKFLSYIGPCPREIQSIYGYKWDIP